MDFTNDLTPNYTETDSKNNIINVTEYCTTELEVQQNSTTKLQAGKKTIAIHTEIDEDIGKAFKNYVQNKHGKLKGCIGIELGIALAYYLESNHRQQLSTNYTLFVGVKTRSDVVLKCAKIKHEFVLAKQYPNFSPESIKKILYNVFGNCDNRTFNKYLRLVIKLSKERPTSFGMPPVFDVTRFCESIPKELNE